MAGHFTLKQKMKLSDITESDVLPESDYATLTPDGYFIQLTYHEGKKEFSDYIARPGIYSIVKTLTGFDLKPTSFVRDEILEEFLSTKEIESTIDCFFENIPLYKEFGIEVPKRGIILYGPAGTGKTSSLNKSVGKYVSDNKTLVIIWHTSRFEAGDVQEFIKSFKYEGVEKIILVAEDLGGVENDQVRMRSDSSLLSLLDNQEKTFNIPVMIIATTNYIGNFEANLMNRPGRFDDKIKVGYPVAAERQALLKFFAKELITEEALSFVASDKCKDLTPAHIKDSYINSRLRKKTLLQTLTKTVEDIKLYNKEFSEKSGSVGLKWD
jgi:AAA+ superfamily predicted ATPase